MSAAYSSKLACMSVGTLYIAHVTMVTKVHYSNADWSLIFQPTPYLGLLKL